MHGSDIGRPSSIRTRDPPAASHGSGVHCDRDAISRTWLVHLGSAPLISCGRAEVRRVNLSPWQSRSGERARTTSPGSPTLRPLPARRLCRWRRLSTAEYEAQRQECAIAPKVRGTFSRGRTAVIARLIESAAAVLLRGQKVGKQIACLAPREMAHIVRDGKGYCRKTRQPVRGRYLLPNSARGRW